MKCAACGYEYRKEQRWYKEAVFFKKGPRKGEFKETKDGCVSINIGDEPFGILTTKVEMPLKEDEYYPEVVDANYKFDSRAEYDREATANLYVCPKCHTVRMELY